MDELTLSANRVKNEMKLLEIAIDNDPKGYAVEELAENLTIAISQYLQTIQARGTHGN